MAIQQLHLMERPYLVKGDLTELNLTDANGRRYDLSGKEKVALCRARRFGQ